MKSRILITIALLAILTGCSLRIGDDEGFLVLSMSEIVSSRTIQPVLNMDPAAYDVEGAGPGGRTFTQNGVDSETVVQASLVPGDWTILVTARNTEGDIIGEGRVTVTVEAGEVTTATVTVRPIDGEGSLDVTITWPEGVLTTPGVEATLEPVGGTFGSIPFVPGTDSAAHRGDYGNGYYVLNLRLVDEGEVVWGTVEAVRIIAGEVSRALFALAEDVNRGGLALTVVNGLDNPIEVTLDGEESIPRGGTMLVTAATSEPVDGYSWYLQGTPIGADTASVVIGEGLDVGHYWLSLVVNKGSILSSEVWKFTVYESVDPILDVDTSLPWADSSLKSYSPDSSDRSAQGFIPGITGELSRVEVYVYSDNVDPQPVDFEIRTAGTDGKPTTTVLATGTGIIPGGPGTNSGWDKWAILALPEPRPVLTAGERYAVIIVHNIIITSEVATPAFGEVYRNFFSNPGQWYGTNGNPDLQIRTYVLP